MAKKEKILQISDAEREEVFVEVGRLQGQAEGLSQDDPEFKAKSQELIRGMTCYEERVKLKARHAMGVLKERGESGDQDEVKAINDFTDSMSAGIRIAREPLQKKIETTKHD